MPNKQLREGKAMNSTGLATPYAWLIHAAHIALATVMATAVFTAPAMAASFDCSKASTPSERMVCANPQLSVFDEDLATTYAAAMARTYDKGALKASQRKWLTNTRNRCMTKDCLVRAYVDRLADLNKVSETRPMLHAASTPLTAAEAAACRTVAAASNEGKLNQYGVRSREDQPTSDQLQKIFGPDAGIYGSEEYWSIDLDDDGVADNFIISTQGTARITFAMGRLARRNSPATLLSEEVGSDGDHRLLGINGRYYILTGYPTPSELWKWRSNGIVERLCVFPRLDPIIALTPESTHPVCDFADPERSKDIAYPFMHALGLYLGGHFSDAMHPVDGMARIDINHDGLLDSVVRVGELRRCDNTFLAVINNERTAIPDTPLNKLLLEGLNDGTGCKLMSVLVFNGEAYIELNVPAGDRHVYSIDGTKAKLLCEFAFHARSDVKLLNSVITP